MNLPSTPSTNVPNTPSTPSTNLPSTPPTNLPGGFFSGNSLSGSDIKDKSDNLNKVPSVIDLKKQESTTLNAPKTTANQDLKKVGKVTLIVLAKLAAVIALSSCFSYYCIISYAHLLPTIDPVFDIDDSDEVKNIQKVKEINGTKEIDKEENVVTNPFLPGIKINNKVKNKPIPVYVSNETKDGKINTNCGGIRFEEEDIKKQFAGYYAKGDLQKTNVSLLYSINGSMPEEYKGYGFIKYSLIKFFQNMVITDFRIITTYFEFFRSFCSEGFSLLFGWIFLIPFIFVFIFCHAVASGWYWLQCIKDMFKTKKCPADTVVPTGEGGYSNDKCIDSREVLVNITEPPSFFSSPFMWFKSKFTNKTSSTPVSYTYDKREDESKSWGQFIGCLAFAYISPWITIFISIFCALYAIFMSLLIKGSYDRPPHEGADKKEIDEKRKTFSIFSYIANNMKFYSRAYLLLFTALLVYESYVDMNLNTALGCVIAIIIVVFGTSVFKKLTMDDLLFTSGQEDKCYDPSASKDPESKVTDPTPTVTAPTPAKSTPTAAKTTPSAVTAPPALTEQEIADLKMEDPSNRGYR